MKPPAVAGTMLMDAPSLHHCEPNKLPLFIHCPVSGSLFQLLRMDPDNPSTAEMASGHMSLSYSCTRERIELFPLPASPPVIRLLRRTVVGLRT